MDAVTSDISTNVSFRVYGVPAPQGSKTAFVRGGRAVVVDGSSTTGRQKLSSWRAEVAREAQNEANTEPFQGPVSVTIRFYMPRPKSAPKSRLYPDRKPDVDKLVRSTLDALSGVIYRDDAQIVRLNAVKLYADVEDPPGANITVAAIPPEVIST